MAPDSYQDFSHYNNGDAEDPDPTTVGVSAESKTPQSFVIRTAKLVIPLVGNSYPPMLTGSGGSPERYSATNVANIG